MTFPARQYSVNGERRSFALLRPISDNSDVERLRDLVLEAFCKYEAQGDESPDVSAVVLSREPDVRTAPSR